MRILPVVFLFLPLSALADVVTVDFVKVLNGNKEEAVYFYENNWKKYRAVAVEKGVIDSYKLLVKESEKGDTDILLITVFESEEQYERREENFAPIMQGSGDSGTALLSDTLPGEFRKVIDAGVYISDE